MTSTWHLESDPENIGRATRSLRRLGLEPETDRVDEILGQGGVTARNDRAVDLLTALPRGGIKSNSSEQPGGPKISRTRERWKSPSEVHFGQRAARLQRHIAIQRDRRGESNDRVHLERHPGRAGQLPRHGLLDLVW